SKRPRTNWRERLAPKSFKSLDARLRCFARIRSWNARASRLGGDDRPFWRCLAGVGAGRLVGTSSFEEPRANADTRGRDAGRPRPASRPASRISWEQPLRRHLVASRAASPKNLGSRGPETFGHTPNVRARARLSAGRQ